MGADGIGTFPSHVLRPAQSLERFKKSGYTILGRDSLGGSVERGAVGVRGRSVLPGTVRRSPEAWVSAGPGLLRPF